MNPNKAQEAAQESAALLIKTEATIKNLLNSCPMPDLDRTILAAQLEDITNHLNTLK